MEKQETEMKWKLEMETGNRNWKLKTEMETQLFFAAVVLGKIQLHCYPSALPASSFCFASLASLTPVFLHWQVFGGGGQWLGMGAIVPRARV